MPDAVLITSSAVIAFVLAFSALQWAFALIALRAARLNRSLARERQQAQDLARARTRFLAHMSHEIRTPLNGVLGLVDVLAADLTDRAARETVAQIQTSGTLLVHILNDVLDMAKLEAGAVRTESVPFAPGALLRQIATSFGPQCRAGGVTLTMAEAPETAGHWSGDPHRISQIVHNILGNAVKFSPGGAVSLSLSAPASGGLLFEITDTGIGMTEAQITALFQEFMQADSDITRRFGGTGLGMAITHRLVTLMGGTISAASAPGVGTRFAVALPLERVAAPAQPVVLDLPAAPADLARLRVLCADDSRTNRLVLEKMLRPMGIDPVIVEDGQAAVAAATAAAFDVYLFDISMPGLSGLETLHLIRGVETAQRRSPARAVAVTANVMAEDVAHYLASGFETHLAKPIRLPALRGLLEGLMPTEAGFAGPGAARGPALRDLI
nr:ATP-binding protein [Fertoeibacter niger]